MSIETSVIECELQPHTITQLIASIYRDVRRPRSGRPAHVLRDQRRSSRDGAVVHERPRRGRRVRWSRPA
jgi:hypothetical protein